jgi:hypothetical protein
VTSDVANVVGFVGMGLIVAAYAYVTASKVPNPFLLHGTNLAGATLLVLSLLVNTNFPALMLEAIWAAIAAVGLVMAVRAKMRDKQP